ncbi:hypothetical protein OG618_00675 [Kitasatospora sp. NBC_01246]|nr:hypothetical protein [Kitasatospora sp. NBC_01246]
MSGPVRLVAVVVGADHDAVLDEPTVIRQQRSTLGIRCTAAASSAGR